jgi:NADH-quinone oxidoreductase subunit G
MMVLNVDGVKLVMSGSNYKTIFQICKLLGKNLPQFCYNDSLVIAGNCRICLVEIKNLPKPIVACATPVTDNIHVFTKSTLVKKARENILEFILINHPLDCPVCDQAGECDLQELSLLEGQDKSRFFIKKRSVSNKDFNFNILTEMTRCIHCTKCIRLSYLIGLSTFGVSNRGGFAEIFDMNYVLFLKKTNYLVSNVIDICPVNYKNNFL